MADGQWEPTGAMKLKFSGATSLHTGLTLTENIVTTGRRNGVLFHVPNPHLPWDKLLFPSKLSCFSLKMLALRSGTHRQLTLMRGLTTERRRHEPPVLSNLVTSSRRSGASSLEPLLLLIALWFVLGLLLILSYSVLSEHLSEFVCYPY